MKMGVREFLFLWSWALKNGWSFPTALKTAEYDPRSDRVTAQFGFIRMPLKVTREGSESCDILKKYGFTQESIDEAVKKYLEE